MDLSQKQAHSNGQPIAMETSMPMHCEICGKSASCPKELQTHRLIHFAADRFTCPICHKVFASTTNMRYHLATHTNEKRYQCKFCLKRFNWRSQLITHEHIHTGKGLYYCPLCSKPCMTKWLLTRHIKVHAKEVNVNIEEILKGDLKRGHPETPGGSPGKANDPESSSDVNSVMVNDVHSPDGSRDTENMSSHKNDEGTAESKDFHCTDCGKHFPTQELMASHLLEHLTGKHYECKNCGATFSKLARLRKHSAEVPECAKSNAGGYENFVPETEHDPKKKYARIRFTSRRPQCSESMVTMTTCEVSTPLSSRTELRIPSTRSMALSPPAGTPTRQQMTRVQSNPASVTRDSPDLKCHQQSPDADSNATVDSDVSSPAAVGTGQHEDCSNTATVPGSTLVTPKLEFPPPSDGLAATSSAYPPGDPISRDLSAPSDLSAYDTLTLSSSEEEDAVLVIDEDPAEMACTDSPKRQRLSEDLVMESSSHVHSARRDFPLDLGKRKMLPAKETSPKTPHIDEDSAQFANISSEFDFASAPLGFRFPVQGSSESSASALNLTTHRKQRRSSGSRGNRVASGSSSSSVAPPPSQASSDTFNVQLLRAIDGQFSKMMVQMQLQHQTQMAHQSAQLGQLRAQLESHCEQSHASLSRMEQRLQGLEMVFSVPLAVKRENNIHNGLPGSK